MHPTVALFINYKLKGSRKGRNYNAETLVDLTFISRSNPLPRYMSAKKEILRLAITTKL